MEIDETEITEPEETTPDMQPIYLAKKDDRVVVHADKQAMFDLDEVEPELEITADEFYSKGCLARLINGEIFLGKTDEEKAEDEKQEKIADCLRQLEKIDHDSGAGRAVRRSIIDLNDILQTISPAYEVDENDDIHRIINFEWEANSLREKIKEIAGSKKKEGKNGK